MTTGRLPIAPSLTPTLQRARIPEPPPPVDRRVVLTSVLAMMIGGVAALVAEGLMRLIALVTNISFYGRVTDASVGPAGNHLGWFVVLPPVIGAVIVGIMARYGSAAIRGHGIPEAMEQVLINRSRIPPRLTLLKPLSAAIAIGTGGPFGAEGPIIATGGAFGSLIGQAVKVTTIERKALLAAGAAAGMAATFGAPVASVLMAIELLLFEFRARSIIPVALASAVATAVRIAFRGAAPVFPMPIVAEPSGSAIAVYIALGALVGLVGVYVTRAVFFVEDSFEHLPVHWMWWPAIGAVAVGVIGYFEPRTMGVGYDNIDAILQGLFPWKVLVLLGALKFLSWAIALGSGTSGGTLAPIFTIGGAVGGLCGLAVATFAPGTAVDPRLAALVGMAALFTGASHSMLAWVVFAFETTHQPVGLLPLLGGCAAAYMVSMLNMRYSIMTEKIARRGLPVARGYEVDYLRQQVVRDWATKPAVSLDAEDTTASVAARLTADGSELTHQGFPVIDNGKLIGVVTRRDLLSGRDQALVRDLIQHPPAIAYAHWPLREAADEMVRKRVGRLPVVEASDPSTVVGIISRSDLLRAYGTQLEEVTALDEPVVRWPRRARVS